MAAGAMMGASTLSAYGAVEQGQMTSQSLNNQANYLDQQGQEAEAQGQFNAMKQQIVAGGKIGQTTAAYGAAGVTGGSGSVMDVLQASHMNSELDRLNILHGADVKSINYQNQASMDRFGGASALQGSYFQALGDLSSGAVKAASLGVGGPGTSPSDPSAGDTSMTDSSIPGGGPGGGASYYGSPNFAQNLYGSGQ